MNKMIGHLVYNLIFCVTIMFLTACGGGSSGGSGDITAPGEITLQATAAGGGSISLTWTEPADSDYDHVMISWMPGNTTGVSVSKGTTTYDINSLTTGTEYTITARSVDTSNNTSNGESIEITPPAVSVPVHYIYTAAELNAIKDDTDNFDDYYILMNDLELSGYNTGEGWIPIGTNASNFTGTFDGNDHVISNLTINRNEENQGLFGLINGARIQNLGLNNVNITSSSGYIGGLIGFSFSGNISNCYCSVTISGDDRLGGLIGENSAAVIEECYTSGSISGNLYIGGLMGRNAGVGSEISNCYSSADVSGNGNYHGGLIGENVYGLLENSFSEGSVSGYNRTGGLIGFNQLGGIENCYSAASITITVDSYDINEGVGGLIGRNDSGSVKYCYATGDITITGSGTFGTEYIGGLIGHNSTGGSYSILQCYSTGDITITLTGAGFAENIGGLIGYNLAFTVSDCYATGNVTANETGDQFIGGFIGECQSGTVSNNYSAGVITCAGSCGGFFGNYAAGTTANIFYDGDTSGLADTAGGSVAKTTTAMKDIDTYTDTATAGLTTAWDFVGTENDDAGTDDIWNISSTINNGYPHLTVFN